MGLVTKESLKEKCGMPTGKSFSLDLGFSNWTRLIGVSKSIFYQLTEKKKFNIRKIHCYLIIIK